MKQKQTIRFTESDLHNIIKESVKKVLDEGEGKFNKLYQDKNYKGQYIDIINKLSAEYIRLTYMYEDHLEEIKKELEHYKMCSWSEFCDYAYEKYGLSRENMDNNWDDFCVVQHNKEIMQHDPY